MIPNVLLLLLWSTPSVFSWRACNTTIAVKQGITDLDDALAIGVTSYKELIEKSKIFVDNSGFVEDVIRGKCKSMLMVGPKKWCRTITLDTLKTFVEIEVNEEGEEILPKETTTNYKLFRFGEYVRDNKVLFKLEKPLLVADFPDVLRYDQGQNPVIYLSFKDVIGKNYEMIEQYLARAISRAYGQHTYMLKVLARLSNNQSYIYRDEAEYKLNKYKEMLKGDQFDRDSIRFLCKVLHEHFNREAMVLMDDYDIPLMGTLQVPEFPEQDLKKILFLMEYLAGTTFKNNEHLFQGIAMGSVRLALPSPYPMWNYYAYRDITYGMMPITDFFSFNLGDARKLLHKHNITGDLFNDVTKWYGGYENKYTCYERAYHPYSMVKYFKHKELISYWEPDEEEKYFHRCIEKQPYIRNNFLKLLSRKLIPVTQIPSIGEEEIIRLRRLTETRSQDIHFLNMFFCYLFRRGYLTTDIYKLNNFIFTDPLKASDYPVRIPNREMAFVLSNWMISYYQKQYKIQDKDLQTAADSLFQFIKYDTNDTAPLENALTSLYQNSVGFFHEEQNDTLTEEDEMHRGEDSVHGVLFCTTLRMHADIRFEMDVFYNRLYKADFVAAYNQTLQLVILELRYTSEPLQSIFNLALKREPIITKKLSYLNTIKLVAIRVTPQKTVQVSVLVKKFIKPKIRTLRNRLM